MAQFIIHTKPSKLAIAIACAALSLGVSTSLLAAPNSIPAVPEANTLVTAESPRYQPTVYPDRVTILPGTNASTSQQVTWRTAASVNESILQITVAQPTPGLHLTATEHQGSFVALETPNGKAHHHRVKLDNLTPDTLYAYRVKGGDTWSNWHQFRTPAATFEPYTALYFGDAQNAVYSHYSRTVREAILTAPRAKVMIYAGDLVNSRDGIHDDEWGEWYDATSWLSASVLQVPAAGNHEFSSDDNEPLRYLLPNWTAHYKVSGNGPANLSKTVYYTDVQGVRYIVMDSTEALQSNEHAKAQAEWLEQVLANNPNRWTVVVHHHPMNSVSMGRDNPPLREHWQPIYEKYNVDLVLQGHDHTYGRDHKAHSLAEQGPVYTVSVAGPKMYLVSDTAQERMDRTGEDTQLFQAIEFSQDQLVYRSLTATGELYDGFTLVKTASGKKFIDEQPNTAERRCENPNKPRPHRCWNGTDLIHAPAALKE